LSDGKSVPFRQGPQLLQGEPAAATGVGYQNGGPEALRSWRLAGFLSAAPAPGARAPQILGALIDGSPSGTTIFDTLATFGTARWNQRTERGETRPDLDLTWAALNSLVLALGALILRGHIERQLPESFTSQLRRWQDSVNTLLREGPFRQRPSDERAVES
jgi:hypothetical protein